MSFQKLLPFLDPSWPFAPKSYRQVVLKKDNSTLVTWINSEYAIAGHKIILYRNNTYEEGWIVDHVYSVVMTQDEMIHLHQIQREFKSRTEYKLKRGKHVRRRRSVDPAWD